MPNHDTNRLREAREARGIAQTTLAERSGLSRQSVGAIEAGRTTPGVDVALRLARALGCSVEELFAQEHAVPLPTEASEPSSSSRVAVAEIDQRWISYALDGASSRVSADGLVVGTKGRHAEVEPLRPLTALRENVVVMGCALGLGLLTDRLNARPGPGRFLWLPRSSTAALHALAKSHTHVAGVHLVDARTGQSNTEDIRRHTRGVPVEVITLARWEAGLVTAPGNPKGVKRAGDLARRGLRIVTREEGSGARRLLDRHLREVGVSNLPQTSIREAKGHLEVAQAIALGTGDVGVATRDAAMICGLAFVPLQEERYDLVVHKASLRDPRIARLFDVMTSVSARRELASLGYDVRTSGERVARLPAA